MKDITELNNFERDFEGPITADLDEKMTVYDFRGLLKYCNDHNISPEEMTDEQRNKFVIDKNTSK